MPDEEFGIVYPGLETEPPTDQCVIDVSAIGYVRIST
jgi:hypothetical protein